MRRPTGFPRGAAGVLMITAAVATAAGGTPAGEDDGEVERMSSLTVTEVPRSELRDVDAEFSDAERAEELRADLGVEEGDGEARIAVPGDVLFGFDEARVRDSAEPLLADVAELIEHQEPTTVRVEGHTDSIGAPAYNQQLSERRAAAVAEFLVDEHDIDQGLLETAGFGEDRPVEPNETEDGDDNPQGRAKNRRVEIVLET